MEVVESIGSTNTALLDAVRSGAVRDHPDPGSDRQPPCLLVAQTQTQGRGRMGRRWVSSAQDGGAASLTFSLSVPWLSSRWDGLSLAVGVGLAEALDPTPAGGCPRLGLKWPNDLWRIDPAAPWGGRKLGGILIETASGANARVAVVGVGLNLGPVAVDESPCGTAWWGEVQSPARAEDVLHAVAPALATVLRRFEDDGLRPFLPRFAARDVLRGRTVTVAGSVAWSGVADGIDPDGSLRVRTADGSLRTVGSGEVSVRPVMEDAPC